VAAGQGVATSYSMPIQAKNESRNLYQRPLIIR